MGVTKSKEDSKERVLTTSAGSIGSCDKINMYIPWEEMQCFHHAYGPYLPDPRLIIAAVRQWSPESPRAQAAYQTDLHQFR